MLLQSGSLKKRGCQSQVFPAGFTGALSLQAEGAVEPAASTAAVLSTGWKQRPRVVV